MKILKRGEGIKDECEECETSVMLEIGDVIIDGLHKPHWLCPVCNDIVTVPDDLKRLAAKPEATEDEATAVSSGEISVILRPDKSIAP